MGSGQVSPRASTSCWKGGRSGAGSEVLIDPSWYAGHGRRQGLRIGAAAHGHVGSSAALASYLAGHETDQVAGLDPAGKTGRPTAPQAALHVAPGPGQQERKSVVSGQVVAVRV